MNEQCPIRLCAVPVGGIDGLTEPEAIFAFEAVEPEGAWAAPDAPVYQASIVSGHYSEVAATLKTLEGPLGGLVLVSTKGEGMEGFLAEISEQFSGVAIAGGASARADLAVGRTFPQADDVAALAIYGEPWKARTVIYHRPSGLRIKVEGKKRRSFSEVESPTGSLKALDFFAELFEQYGLMKKPWDRCALFCHDGRLLHLSPGHDLVQAGADLPENREVEIALFDHSFGDARMRDAIEPQSLVFGCAGLHGLLPAKKEWSSGLSTAYLFGEVVALDNGPAFANLSMTVLTPPG